LIGHVLVKFNTKWNFWFWYLLFIVLCYFCRL